MPLIDLPIPENEKERLKALQNYEILDSLNEREFDRITELASLICDVPISLVSLIDANRQWFKSNKGLEVNETSRELAFCQYAIMDIETMEVEDATRDERFKTNVLVLGDPKIRFYAGHPLIDPNGYALGTLCVIDRKPKKLSKKQKKVLQLLAEEVVELIVKKREREELKYFEKLFLLSDDLICIIGTDGVLKDLNPAFEKILGWDTHFLLNTSFFELVHPDDMEKTKLEIEKLSTGSLTTLFEHRYQTKSQEWVILQWVATLEASTGNLFAVARNITELKAKEELQISEEKLRTFFESSQGFMCTHDLRGNFLTVNTSFAQSLGYTKEELLKMNLTDVIPEDSLSLMKNNFSELINKGRIESQVIAKNKNGSLLFLLYSAVMAKDGDGNSYIIGNATNITERHHLELKLKHTTELLEQTNQVARIGGWEFDVKNQVPHWTSVSKQIHEVPQDFEPDLSTTINFYKEGESRNKISEALNLAIREGRPWDEELQIVNYAGEEKWVRALGQVDMENGVCKRVFGTFQDIDTQKKLEIEFKNSKKLLEDVLNAATEVGIIATDSNGMIQVFNKGAENQLGYTAEEMIGQPIHAVLQYVEEEVINRSHELTKELGYPVTGFDIFTKKAEIDGSETREWTYFHKNGSPVTLEMVVTTIRDEAGNITGYLAVSTNISDLKKAKADLETLSTRLQKQNTQLLNFAHITSHNLRAPVSNLNSLVYFYNESTSVEDKDLLFTKFEIVIKHLSGTLEELMEALKIQEDLNIEIEKLYFEEIFNKTKETLVGHIMETNSTITYDFSAAASIDFPKSYLESIFLNLLSNSIKYRSRDRELVVHFKTQLIDKQIILTASDNGLGIDLKKHGNKIFGLNKTFHRNPDARGVGLFIVKTQVEAMGGNISVESEVNRGTSFTIVFNINKQQND